MRMNKLEEAVESYVHALQFMVDDADARHNLEVALRRLDEMKQQPQQQQQQQDQDGESDEQEGEPQQGESGDPGEGQRQPGEQPERDQQPQPDQSGAQEQPDSLGQNQQPSLQELTGLSKEDALRLLRALEEQEKALQNAKRKAAFKRVAKKGKDW